MAETSTIEWTEATWNPITGCTMVSAGCTNCYAMGLAATRLRNHPSRQRLTRESGGRAVWTGEVRLNDQWLDQPLRWRRPRRIFVCAHGDLFHEAVPDEWIDRVFAVMALAPHHTFQVLTKRPERARAYISSHRTSEIGQWAYSMLPSKANPEDFLFAVGSDEDPDIRVNDWPLPNVWLGTSIEDQATADARVPHLLVTPAAVRFLSAEPLLGPVSLSNYGTGETINWVIVGGESGPGARPMHPDWARSLRDQSQAAGVAYFFKQWGEWAPNDAIPVSMTGQRKLIGGGTLMIQTGKKAAGRLLDGRTWDEVPRG